jgi:3-isopropylmalate dehydratase small subunit
VLFVSRFGKKARPVALLPRRLSQRERAHSLTARGFGLFVRPLAAKPRPLALGWQKGIRAIVGESFAEIFFGNCVSLGVPCVVVDAAGIEVLQKAVAADPTLEVSVDLQRKEVGVGAARVVCKIPEGVRQQFFDGRWDTTGELLQNRDAIQVLAKKLPYFSQF